MKSIGNARRATLWLLAAVAVIAGCQDDHGPLSAPALRQPVAVGLEVSSLTAGAGDRIAVAVRSESDEPLLGLQGYVRFDPSRLSYVGQSTVGKTLVLVNDQAASRGELRVISVEPAGLTARAATLIFTVRSASYTTGLRYAFEAATSQHGDYKLASPRVLTAAADLTAGEAARYTANDWMARLAPELYAASRNRPAMTPGQYAPNLKYGDANLDGTINVLDVVYLANVSVGAVTLIDATNRDAVIAGNVRPVNGGTAGTPRPGVEPGSATPDGTINVLDVVAVANSSVGTTVAVVGDVIPGRGPSQTTWGDTVVINADITTNTHFTKNHLYQIGDATKANVYVTNNATLTIDPGTRVEGWYGTGVFGSGGVGAGQGTLVIRRDGRVVADGTALEPIILTCRLPNFAGPRGEAIGTRWPGCWGGLIIAGNATINSDAATSNINSPSIPSRGTAGGCDQDQDESDPATLYGGCNDADSSGVLRYVRSEYGGARFTATQERNGITFNGVGSHTVVDYVQSHASLDDGTEYFGGTVNVKHLLLTANEDDNFDYNYGYRGSVQYVIVQADSLDGDRCFEMDNNGIDAGNPSATPRANPTIFNVTCVGKQQPYRYTASTSLPATCHTQLGPTGTPGANCVNQALLFRQNTSGTMRNVLVYRYASALDFDQPSGAAGGGLVIDRTGLCDAVGAGILKNAALSVGPVGTPPSGSGPSVAADQDNNDPGYNGTTFVADCGGYTTPATDGTNLEALYEANPANNITVYAAGDANGDYLVNPLDRQVPDLRPKPGSAATTLPVAPSPGTVNGYTFETTTYLGAVSPDGIPWYAGWTRGMTDATHP
ncbi:MAG TPA: hypothetical protein VLV16_13760 [Gemmatimonadales bacterium]|nr:hypothetical protein [Gemmatimonadales bacterium]